MILGSGLKTPVYIVHIMILIRVKAQNLLIKQCSLKENLELSGTIKVPSHMAT